VVLSLRMHGALSPFPHMSSWSSASFIRHRDNFTLTCLVIRTFKSVSVRGNVILFPCLATLATSSLWSCFYCAWPLPLSGLLHKSMQV
jgi:hypothetical protein